MRGAPAAALRGCPPCPGPPSWPRRAIDAQGPFAKDGAVGGHLARPLVGRGERSRLDLAGLHVGLVERVDPDHRAGHGDRHLPAEELLEDHLLVGQGDAHHRLAGLLERAHCGVARRIVVALEPHIGEHPVGPVHRWRTERLQVDRDQALALLAGGFGDQLLEPCAKVADLVGDDQAHLVAALCSRRRPEARPAGSRDWPWGARPVRTPAPSGRGPRTHAARPDRSPRPEPCRSSTGPNNDRRSSALHGRRARTPAPSPSSPASSRDQ